MLRSDDALTYEEGYHWLQGDNLRHHITAIVDLPHEQQDPEMRAKFVELLGDADLVEYIPVLVAELPHENREVHLWAYNQPSLSAHAKANAQAQAYRRSHPDEDFY